MGAIVFVCARCKEPRPDYPGVPTCQSCGYQGGVIPGGSTPEPIVPPTYPSSVRTTRPADEAIQTPETPPAEPIQSEPKPSRRLRWYWLHRSLRHGEVLPYGPEPPDRMKKHRLQRLYKASLRYFKSWLQFGAAWRTWLRLTLGVAAVAVIFTAITIRPNLGAEIRGVFPGPGPTRIAKPSNSNTRSSPSPSVHPAPSSAGPLNEADATNELQKARLRSLVSVKFSNQWVAQLASKNPGITDPYQKTARGGHTFEATDILDEYEQDHQDPTFGSYVWLFLSTDFGSQQLYGGHPLWVTVVELNSFSSAQDVTSWCKQEFPDLPEKVRDDHCVARQLSPPARND